MRRGIILILIVVLAIAPAALVFASGDQEDGVQRHAFIFKNTGNPYGDKQMEGFEEGIEEQGYEAILRAPDQPTAEAQIQIIDQLITQRVASISITGNDFDALEPVLTRAMDEGIVVI